jgi:pyridoxine 5-phosphate synthase
MTRLGVNVDHVATLRQARRARYPDPVDAALAAERGGADQITVHLRQDRRHIQDADLLAIAAAIGVPLNVELAVTDEMIGIALRVRPHTVTLVPERAGEITTEGGLDLRDPALRRGCIDAARALRGAGVAVSLFVDPDPELLDAARGIAADCVEINTASWSEAADAAVPVQLLRLQRAFAKTREGGFRLAAGHGLHEKNVGPIAALRAVEEFNIGHAIVARALFIGMEAAVASMKALLR